MARNYATRSDHALGRLVQSLPSWFLLFVLVLVVVLAPSAVVWRGYERATTMPELAIGPSNPELLTIETLGVRNAEILPMALQGPVLNPPDNPAQVGWWNKSADLGAPEGSTLLTSHKVEHGNGVFEHLIELRQGDTVVVSGAEGSYEYVVSSMQVLTTDELAERADVLFSQTGPHQLVMVTCEDWDGDDFQSNSVVIANPVAVTPQS